MRQQRWQASSQRRKSSSRRRRRQQQARRSSRQQTSSSSAPRAARAGRRACWHGGPRHGSGRSRSGSGRRRRRAATRGASPTIAGSSAATPARGRTSTGCRPAAPAACWCAPRRGPAGALALAECSCTAPWQHQQQLLAWLVMAWPLPLPPGARGRRAHLCPCPPPPAPCPLPLSIPAPVNPRQVLNTVITDAEAYARVTAQYEELMRGGRPGVGGQGLVTAGGAGRARARRAGLAGMSPPCSAACRLACHACRLALLLPVDALRPRLQGLHAEPQCHRPPCPLRPLRAAKGRDAYPPVVVPPAEHPDAAERRSLQSSIEQFIKKCAPASQRLLPASLPVRMLAGVVGGGMGSTC